MSVFSFDTSALVKRYMLETGTEWVRAPRGISRSERDVVVRLLVQHCATEYELVPVDRAILDRALLLTQHHRLRGYDAVHLASALAANVVLIAVGSPALTLVTSDRDLRDAAAHEGLAVDNPEDHL